MKRPNIRLGPLALLLTVITLCLATLAILTLSTAQADKSLARRYADTVSVRYSLERQGQALCREIDTLLRQQDADGLDRLAREQGLTREGPVIIARLEENGACLSVAVDISGESAVVTDWRIIKNWDEDIDMENIWNGRQE